MAQRRKSTSRSRTAAAKKRPPARAIVLPETTWAAEVDLEQISAQLEGITHDRSRKGLMLAALTLTSGNVTRACTLAKVPRRTHYSWLDTDPLYHRAVNDGLRPLMIGRVIDEMQRRAIDGVPRLKFTKEGKPIRDPTLKRGQLNEYGHGFYVEREYSDALLSRLAQALDPERFSPRRSLGEDDELGGESGPGRLIITITGARSAAVAAQAST